MRKAVTMLLAASMFLSNVPMVFASNPEEVSIKERYSAGQRAAMEYVGVNLLDLDRELPPILEDANSVILTENGLYDSVIEATYDDFVVTVDWNRLTNEVVIEEEYLTPVVDPAVMRLLTEDNTITNTFTVELGASKGDNGFVFLNTVDFNGMELNLEEAINMQRTGNIPRTGLAGVIGGTLLDRLIGLGLTVKVGEMIYALAQEIANTLKKKNYDHYYAVLEKNPLGTGRNLFIGDPFPSTDSAVHWFNFTNDVFSPREDMAELVAFKAGGGKNPPLWHDRHNLFEPSYYPHFHRWDKSTDKDAHSFHLLR